MNLKFIKGRIVIGILVSAMLAPVGQAFAAEEVTVQTTVEKQDNANKFLKQIDESSVLLVEMMGEATRMAEEAKIAAEKEINRQKGANVAEYAKQFVGNPYVYGGTSLTNGADCSGFVMSVYAHFGITLPHSSYSMRSVGYKVSLDEIQPGDIVCFPGHVGIYAGDNLVVNAVNEKRGIRMSNLYARHIVTVRRIF